MAAFLGNHYTCNSFTRRLKRYFLLVQKGMIFAILSDYVIILGSILRYLQLKNSLYAIHIPGSFWNLMLGALVLYFAKSVWSRMTCFFTNSENSRVDLDLEPCVLLIYRSTGVCRIEGTFMGTGKSVNDWLAVENLNET